MATYVLGEFRSEPLILAAARQLRSQGHRGLDIHSPYPLHGADETLELRRSRVPAVALILGLTGAVSGYVLQVYCNAISYRINVGNRPPHAPPSFIPITFELGVLFAAIAIFVSVLAFAGFPRVHHPVFEVEAFRSATVDGLWLSAEVPAEQAEAVAAELRRLGALQVSIVPEESP